MRKLGKAECLLMLCLCSITGSQDICGFRCVGGLCIPREKQFDGVDDCGNNSDEVTDPCTDPEDYSCLSGECIPLSRAYDNFTDCSDGSDEYDNLTYQSSTTHFSELTTASYLSSTNPDTASSVGTSAPTNDSPSSTMASSTAKTSTTVVSSAPTKNASLKQAMTSAVKTKTPKITTLPSTKASIPSTAASTPSSTRTLSVTTLAAKSQTPFATTLSSTTVSSNLITSASAESSPSTTLSPSGTNISSVVSSAATKSTSVAASSPNPETVSTSISSAARASTPAVTSPYSTKYSTKASSNPETTPAANISSSEVTYLPNTNASSTLTSAAKAATPRVTTLPSTKASISSTTSASGNSTPVVISSGQEFNTRRPSKASACWEDEFTCHKDGSCVPASARCDQNMDCPDGSDELLCWREVARNKRAGMICYQTGSTSGDRVVDGDTSCFSAPISHPHIDPWFWTDLGGKFLVSSVRITTAVRGMYRVSIGSKKWKEVPYHFCSHGPAKAEEWATFKCKHPQLGRFVAVEHLGKVSLSLCEVQVYADCERGYYGPNCDKECPSRCQEPKSCVTSTGTCKCKKGYMGFYCHMTCDNACVDGCDQDNGSCTACHLENYGTYCGKTCPVNCAADSGCNRHTGRCDSCTDGYYGPNCTSNCLDICTHRRCDQDTGRCGECVAGFFGHNCSVECGPNCKRCVRESGDCTLCEPGYFGPFCSYCPDHCSWLGTCDQESGDCMCQNGFYGYRCQEECGSTCGGNRTCDKENGTCDSCEKGWWGPLCDIECPEHCNISGCSQTQGDCPCPVTMYGSNCDQYCSDTCGGNGHCYRDTGHCLICTQGDYGDFCQHRCGMGCVDDVCNRDGTCNCTRGHIPPFCDNEPDLALYKPTAQSTTRGEYRSFKAVNGNSKEDCMANEYSCTLSQRQPWWKVKLGGTFRVSRVEFMPRASGPWNETGHAMYRLNMAGTNINGTFGSVVTEHVRIRATSMIMIWRINRRRRAPLCLCWVRIYGGCAPGVFGANCGQQCPKNCVRGCNKKTGRCYRCKTGWFGDTCNKVCSGGCGGSGHCHQETGHCYECADGHFGDFCGEVVGGDTDTVTRGRKRHRTRRRITSSKIDAKSFVRRSRRPRPGYAKNVTLWGQN